MSLRSLFSSSSASFPSSLNPQTRKLRKIILDGGLSSELEALGAPLDSPLWSSTALLRTPALVERAHENFVDAGANVILTATYQMAAAVSIEQQRELLELGLQLANRAVDGTSALVVVSVGPFGARLNDGSEYNGAYGAEMSREELIAAHRPTFELLRELNVNNVAFETIPSYHEALALQQLIEEFEIDCWLSFSCRNGTELRDGFSLASCVQKLTSKHIVAVGVNCIDPKHGTSLSKEIENNCELPIVIYANRGEEWDAAGRCWKG